MPDNIQGSRRFQNINTPLGILVKPEIDAGSQYLDSLIFVQRVQAIFDGVTTMNFVKTFLRDESGASAAEYALILAVVGAGIAVAAYNLGEAVQTAINFAETEVEECAGANASSTCS